MCFAQKSGVTETLPDGLRRTSIGRRGERKLAHT
jgi:hypothetical protein